MIDEIEKLSTYNFKTMVYWFGFIMILHYLTYPEIAEKTLIKIFFLLGSLIILMMICANIILTDQFKEKHQIKVGSTDLETITTISREDLS